MLAASARLFPLRPVTLRHRFNRFERRSGSELAFKRSIRGRAAAVDDFDHRLSCNQDG